MEQVTKRENLLAMWFVWHFSEMPAFLFSVWKNYINFGADFFSAPLLLGTLFSPWRKYTWNYPRGFSIVGYLNTIISNLFSRIIGAICRSVLIIFGVIAQLFIVAAGVVIIAAWLLLPFVCAGLMWVLIYGYNI